MSEPSQVEEEELARKYRQPKGVEQFGVEVIPDRLRTVRWWDIFSIVLNFVINPGTIVIGGALIAAGMSFWQAMLTGVLSIVVGFSTYLIAATVGVDYGIPGLVSMRSAFGIRGAWLTSILRAISSVYWFAFQTVAAAAGLAAVLEALLHRSVSVLWMTVLCAVLQLVVAMVGYHSLMKLSRVAFVFKVVFSAVIVAMLMLYPQESFEPSSVFAFAGTAEGKVALIAMWTVAWGTSWYSNFTDAADFCRYSKSRMEMWLGTLGAAVVGQLICSFIGGYAVAAMGGNADNAFTVIVTATQGIAWLLVLLFIYIVLDSWIINVQNLYTAGLAISSLVSRMGRFWGTLIVGALGVALSTSQDLISGFDGYMEILGHMFAPMAGVFIANYLYFGRGRIAVAELFKESSSRYWYWSGVNWVAMFWVVVGYIIDTIVPQQYLNIVVSAVVSGALYAVSMKWISRYTQRGRDAITLVGDEPRSVLFHKRELVTDS